MSAKYSTPKTNRNDEMNWLAFILLLIIFIVFEVLGDYCNRHAEEHRQKSWERFEERNAEMMHMVDWSKATYH